MLTFDIEMTEAEPNVPIIFRSKGEILFSGRNYLVPLILDKEALWELTTPIKDALGKLVKRYNTLTAQQWGNTNHTLVGITSTNLVGNIPSNIDKHLTLLINDVAKKEKSLKGFLWSIGQEIPINNGRSRSPRGLINAGGKLLKFLFGTATQEELNDQENIISSLNKLTEEERNKINLHSSILNMTSLRLTDLEESQNEVIKALNSLDADFASLKIVLERNEKSVADTVQLLGMTSAISYISSCMNDLFDILEEFHEGLVSLRQGQLSHKIISPEMLLKIIASLTIKGLRPIWPAANKYIPAYYKYTEVVPIASDDIAFVIAIPLLGEPEINLQLHQVMTLPYPVSKEAVVTFGSLPEYFAISDDHSLYIELNDLDSCREYKKIFICPITQAIHKESLNSCLYALYLNKNVNKFCKKHLSGPLEAPKLISDGHGWLYATSNPIDLTITCPGSTRTITINTGVGRLNLENSCRITSKYSVIPASINYRANNLTLEFQIEFTLNLTKVEQTEIEIFSKEPLFKDLMSLSGNHVPLTALSGNLAKINHMGTNRVNSSAALGLSTTNFLILTILGGGVLISVVCLRKDKQVSRLFRYRANDQEIQELTPVHSVAA